MVLMLLAGCGGSTAPATSAAASAPVSGLNSAAPAMPGAAKPSPLVEFAAGTLSVPFKQLDHAFVDAHPGVQPQPRFGGSVAMAKQVSQLGQLADVVGVADYHVIPQQLFAQNGKAGFATWLAGFASNAITFVYTPQSKGASTINAGNWYKVLADPGVQIGRSNPDTDPSGYQTLQMLKLAEAYYKAPGLYNAILKNAPASNMRDTETELISALKAGQIDYLAIYRTDALQNHLEALTLPPQIDLSDAKYTQNYATAVVNTKNGALKGSPIVYAVTIPSNAPHPVLARQFVSLLLGPVGQSVLKKNGFVNISPAYASSVAAAPTVLAPLLQPWPAS
ncbi:MAG: extracellular solute-binding protein [Chloroflexota bacterium]